MGSPMPRNEFEGSGNDYRLSGDLVSWLAAGNDPPHGSLAFLRALAEECVGHRAAKRADAERVRVVVEVAALQAIGGSEDEPRGDVLASRIATHVADQLASAAVLSGKDRDVALRMRKGLQYDGEFTDLLDRLLGAAK